MDIFAKMNLLSNEALPFFLKKDGLVLKVYLECVRRARREDNGILGMGLLEFTLSRTEYELFGLKKGQDKKIERTLNILMNHQFIEKVANKTANKNGNIFRLVNGKYDFMKVPVANTLANKQPTDSQQIAIKEDSKIVRIEDKNKKETLVSQKETVVPFPAQDNFSEKVKDEIDFELFQAFWNDNLSKYGISPIKLISESRKRKIIARFRRDNNFLESFKICIQKIMASDFLTGQNSEWKVSFDWVIENDKNYLKILEGNYDANRASTVFQRSAVVENRMREIKQSIGYQG